LPPFEKEITGGMELPWGQSPKMQATLEAVVVKIEQRQEILNYEDGRKLLELLKITLG